MHKLVVQHVWLSPDLLYIFGFDSPTCLCILTVHKITNLISLGRKILPQFLISKSYKMHRRPVSKCPFSSSCFFVFLFVSWNEDSAWYSMLIGGGLGGPSFSPFCDFSEMSRAMKWVWNIESESIQMQKSITMEKNLNLGPDFQLEGSLCLV